MALACSTETARAATDANGKPKQKRLGEAPVEAYSFGAVSAVSAGLQARNEFVFVNDWNS